MIPNDNMVKAEASISAGTVKASARTANLELSAKSMVVITEKGDPGYTPIKGIDYFDGYTPVKGVDYFDGDPGKDGEPGKDGAPFTYDMFTPEQLAALKGDKGDPGYTPIKGIDYFDGYTPIKGKDYFDGYTPVKNVDYFDGKDGTPGKDGKTPVKGVDYFDGYTPRKGVDYFDGEPGYTPVKGKDYFDGYTPQKGVDYFDGEPGYTPVKGVDYFDGAKGDTPVITATKSDKVTTVYSDGVEIATINDGEDGAGAVTDVQVAGKSILANGVANIQLHTGLKTNANNVIYLPDPNATQIGGRAYNVALTLQMLDNGVKAAMCDGVGPDWSDAEKAAARARMGVESDVFIAEYGVTTYQEIAEAVHNGKVISFFHSTEWGILHAASYNIDDSAFYAFCVWSSIDEEENDRLYNDCFEYRLTPEDGWSTKQFSVNGTRFLPDYNPEDDIGKIIRLVEVSDGDDSWVEPAWVDIPEPVTDDHINALIDAKLGGIENGTY